MEKVNWKLDTNHSEVGFKVKHMMITNVSGNFTEFDVKASTEGENFSSGHVIFTAKAASVNTNSEQRDNHLRSAEFFDVENHPAITFKSVSFTKKSGDDYVLNGDLTIKGVSKSVSLEVEFGGIQKDPYGQTKAGFAVSGKINRKDFGLNWNAALEAGGVMVSDEVKIHCEIQLIKVQ